MKLTSLLSLLFMLLSISGIQAQTWDWARSINGAEQNIGYSMSKDGAGNIYLAGSFSVTSRFGAAGDTITAKGQEDMYIAKYSSTGNLLWVKTGGGMETDRALSVSAIPGGGCYITGYITGTVVWGTDTLDGGFGGNVFVAKYDANGVNQWIRTTSSLYTNYGRGITVLADGGCAVTGYFMQSADFGSQTISHTGAFSGGESDLFIARYDGQGNLVWVKGAGGNRSYCNGNSISTDGNGNIYLTGSFSLTAMFDNLPLTAATSIAGLSGEDDIFVAKYSSSGVIQWVKHAGGGGDPNFTHCPDIGYSIVTDSGGNSYVSGLIYGSVMFDGISLQSAGNRDAFVAKYNTSGDVVWAKLIGGPGEDYSPAISMDAANRIYVGGEFTQSFTLGSLLVSQGSLDAFLAAFTSDGGLLWALSLGGQSTEHCMGIDADANGIHVAGMFSSTSLQLGSTTLYNTPNVQQGYSDVFFGKITPPADPTSIEGLSVTTGDIRLFPNPVKDRLYFLPAEELRLEIEIVDATGRKVYEISGIAGKGKALEASFNVAAGTYVYRVKYSGKVQSGIIVKQ